MSESNDSFASHVILNKKNATKNKILQAALTCFAGKGYHQTTMDDIVSESGLSKGALYWHFKSKQELFVSLLESFIVGFTQELIQTNTNDTMSAADKMRALTEAFAHSSEEFFTIYKLTMDFWAQSTEDETIRELFVRTIDQAMDSLTGIIEAGIAAGEFRQVDASQVALGWFATLDALGLYKAILGEKVDLIRATEAILEVFMAGLKR